MTRRQYYWLITALSLTHLLLCAWLVISASHQHSRPHPYSGLVLLTVVLNTLLHKQANPSLVLLFTALLTLLGLGGRGMDSVTCVLGTLATCGVMTGLLLLAPESET